MNFMSHGISKARFEGILRGLLTWCFEGADVAYVLPTTKNKKGKD